MRSIIIDGKDSKGRRVSASIPTYLYDYVLASFDFDDLKARAWIRSQFVAAEVFNSAAIQHMCMMRVVKPSLHTRVVDRVVDGWKSKKVDIEDV